MWQIGRAETLDREAVRDPEEESLEEIRLSQFVPRKRQKRQRCSKDEESSGRREVAGGAIDTEALDNSEEESWGVQSAEWKSLSPQKGQEVFEADGGPDGNSDGDPDDNSNGDPDDPGGDSDADPDEFIVADTQANMYNYVADDRDCGESSANTVAGLPCRARGVAKPGPLMKKREAKCLKRTAEILCDDPTNYWHDVKKFENLLQTKRDAVTSSAWQRAPGLALKTRPYLKRVHGGSGTCEVCRRIDRQAIKTEDEEKERYTVGRFCLGRSVLYHALHHFQFHLVARLHADLTAAKAFLREHPHSSEKDPVNLVLDYPGLSSFLEFLFQNVNELFTLAETYCSDVNGKEDGPCLLDNKGMTLESLEDFPAFGS
eukprot:jgi/Mesen1/9679/ME000680S09096